MKQVWLNISPVFRRFLMSYMIVLMIPLIAGYVSYRTSIDVAEQSSLKTSIMTLQQSKDLIERRLAEVQGFTKQLAINQDLARLMTARSDEQNYDVYGLWKMMRDIASYSQTNDFLSNFYIYLRNSHLVLTPSTVYYRPELFYESNHYEGMTFETWKKNFLEKSNLSMVVPQHNYVTKTHQQTVVTFVQALPLNSFDTPLASVVVLIDTKKMSTYLSGITNQYGGWAFVRNHDGETVLSEGITGSDIAKIRNIPSGKPGDISRAADDMLLISIRDELSGWVYTAGVPKSALMINANRIKNITGILTAISLISGLVIGLVLAYRSSAPINNLINSLKKQLGLELSTGIQDYDFIAGNISSLIASNRQLEQELHNQVPLIRDAFIKRLLVGEFYNEEELAAASAQAGVNIKGGAGYAGLAKINTYGGSDSRESLAESSVARLIVRQSLMEAEPDMLVTDWGQDKLAFLLLRTSKLAPDEALVIQRLQDLAGTLFSHYHMPVQFGMGRPFEALADVGRSFGEAAEALDYAAFTDEGGVIRYEDSSRDASLFYYPIETETRLLNTIKSGDGKEAMRILEHIAVRNFQERELSREMTEQLIGELKGTLLKLLDQKAGDDPEFTENLQCRIAQIQPFEGTDRLLGQISEMIGLYCSMIEEKKNALHHQTVQQVKHFLASAYGDADLTLYHIAKQVGRPEKYVSTVFKESEGEPWFDYLERLRIDKASELLLNRALKIDDIAERVGYNSAHSFRRAFKRARGISPSMFREAAELGKSH
ncbi:helix-turn-helix domain-containing protein [Paenibacillus cellulositrophicus]|uniref:helix-turn-helix domain-containing protein n=1 Tax=Paenibacillus cellulositrophicus TaxID=562959 RepID=UPI00203E8083|nr:helix-turn-helix domain-containing protein [Paenibacillus cellulositrophicus]MCM2998142.1 helix-turn-helix domain-containing protein [Paenibacillus cellulositrophicus]